MQNHVVFVWAFFSLVLFFKISFIRGVVMQGSGPSPPCTHRVKLNKAGERRDQKRKREERGREVGGAGKGQPGEETPNAFVIELVLRGGRDLLRQEAENQWVRSQFKDRTVKIRHRGRHRFRTPATPRSPGCVCLCLNTLYTRVPIGSTFLPCPVSIPYPR